MALLRFVMFGKRHVVYLKSCDRKLSWLYLNVFWLDQYVIFQDFSVTWKIIPVPYFRIKFF